MWRLVNSIITYQNNVLPSVKHKEAFCDGSAFLYLALSRQWNCNFVYQVSFVTTDLFPICHKRLLTCFFYSLFICIFLCGTTASIIYGIFIAVSIPHGKFLYCSWIHRIWMLLALWVCCNNTKTTKINYFEINSLGSWDELKYCTQIKRSPWSKLWY